MVFPTIRERVFLRSVCLRKKYTNYSNRHTSYHALEIDTQVRWEISTCCNRQGRGILYCVRRVEIQMVCPPVSFLLVAVPAIDCWMQKRFVHVLAYGGVSVRVAHFTRRMSNCLATRGCPGRLSAYYCHPVVLLTSTCTA